MLCPLHGDSPLQRLRGVVPSNNRIGGSDNQSKKRKKNSSGLDPRQSPDPRRLLQKLPAKRRKSTRKSYTEVCTYNPV